MELYNIYISLHVTRKSKTSGKKMFKGFLIWLKWSLGKEWFSKIVKKGKFLSAPSVQMSALPLSSHGLPQSCSSWLQSLALSRWGLMKVFFQDPYLNKQSDFKM